jgi:two-component system response regulator AtoC
VKTLISLAQSSGILFAVTWRPVGVIMTGVETDPPRAGCHPDRQEPRLDRQQAEAGVVTEMTETADGSSGSSERSALREPIGDDAIGLRAQLDALGVVPSRWEEGPAYLNSLRMRGVKALVDRAAGTDATVLVWGESGVGKEMVARTLHRLSQRRDRPFVKVNCAALPPDLLESELFGYERGAFTGAHRQKPGKFELADTGTIFLDEIGEFPLNIQAKLLQVLQDREFSRLGGRRDINVDVRVVAATNKNLEALAASGRFREDLFYRLNVVSIHVPPLRERREEIPILVEHFLDEYSRRYGQGRLDLSPGTLRSLLQHAWPGNVRELENVAKRIVVLGTDDWVAGELGPACPAPVQPGRPARGGRAFRPANPDELGLKEIARRAARDAERVALKTVLEQVRWHRVEAARRLRISYKTLLQKIRDCGLEP